MCVLLWVFLSVDVFVCVSVCMCLFVYDFCICLSLSVCVLCVSLSLSGYICVWLFECVSSLCIFVWLMCTVYYVCGHDEDG